MKWEIIGYFSLALLIIGQIVIGFDFWIGQGAYLIADILLTFRCFCIKQTKADKIKNIALTAICIGVCIVKIFT